jgi:hypothetical protein
MRSIWTLAIIGIVVGCTTMSIDIERYHEGEIEPIAGECWIRFFRTADRIGDSCNAIGRVEIRDTGFSRDCGSDRIRREVRRAACDMGGNVAVLKRRPNPMVTCVETNVEIYRCRSDGDGIDPEVAPSGAGPPDERQAL